MSQQVLTFNLKFVCEHYYYPFCLGNQPNVTLVSSELYLIRNPLYIYINAFIFLNNECKSSLATQSIEQAIKESRNLVFYLKAK